jgi:hypothetical protein
VRGALSRKAEVARVRGEKARAVNARAANVQGKSGRQGRRWDPRREMVSGGSLGGKPRPGRLRADGSEPRASLPHLALTLEDGHRGLLALRVWSTAAPAFITDAYAAGGWLGALYRNTPRLSETLAYPHASTRVVTGTANWAATLPPRLAFRLRPHSLVMRKHWPLESAAPSSCSRPFPLRSGGWIVPGPAAAGRAPAARPPWACPIPSPAPARFMAANATSRSRHRRLPPIINPVHETWR